LARGGRKELTVDFALEVASNTADVLLDDGSQSSAVSDSANPRWELRMPDCKKELVDGAEESTRNLPKTLPRMSLPLPVAQETKASLSVKVNCPRVA